MTFELPEDLSKWPDSPWQLFGLERTTSKSDVRKAYAKLIRHYRPDSHPAKFQKINQAYELLRQWTSNDASMPIGFDNRSEHRNESRNGEDGLFPSAGQTNQNEPLRLGEDFDTFEVFCAEGDDTVGEAWTKISERFDRMPTAELAAAKYWLLMLDPTLDESHNPVDILCNAIRQRGNAQVLTRLLEQEISEPSNSEVLATLDLNDVLRATTPHRRSAMLLSRWQQLSASGSWNLIGADLEQHRDEFVTFDPLLWVRMLILLVGICAWEEAESPRRIVAAIRKEIDESDVQIRIATELDQLDRLDTLLAARKKSDTIQGDGLQEEIRTVIPMLWIPCPARRKALVQLSLKLTSTTPLKLRELDDVKKVCERELNHIYEVFDEEMHYGPILHEVDAEALGDRILQFYKTASAKAERYGQIRHKILNFCIREFVYPEWIATVVENQDSPFTILVGGHPQHASQAIREDLALRVLCRAQMFLDS